MKKIKFLIASLLMLTAVHSADAGSLKVTKNITAQNTFSDALALGKASGAVLTLSGTWSATITIQRMDILGNWNDVTDNNGSAVALTTNGTYSIYEPTLSTQYRFGVKTGNFTSGTVAGVLEYN